VNVIPFRAVHATGMTIQVAQQGEATLDAVVLEKLGDAFTITVGDRPIASIGRVKMWNGRFELWAMLSDEASAHMFKITRVAQRLLQLCEGRLEVIVRSDFEQGHRWAKLLGFGFHHHEERFLPNGSDADIYVRFQ
jgi:hypothetical protein